MTMFCLRALHKARLRKVMNRADFEPCFESFCYARFLFDAHRSGF